tara:strand:- start:1965 stop:2258 length:294 start_codon:yes stop_codon:yes gene_type:complete
MSKAREKLAEGIISKLFNTFYTKKAEAYARLMMQADPEVGAAAERLQKATDDLKQKLVTLNKKNTKWIKKHNVRVDSDGLPNLGDIQKVIRQKGGSN